MLPQMAKTQKSDKTYSADESSLRGGKKKAAKNKVKRKENKVKKTNDEWKFSANQITELPFHGTFFNKPFHH